MVAYSILCLHFSATSQVKNNVNNFSMQIAISILTRRRRHNAPNVPAALVPRQFMRFFLDIQVVCFI